MIIPAKPVPFDGSILVTGATGTVGRHVVAELLKRGVRVRAGVRSVSKAAFLRNLGAEVVELDYARPTCVRSAFKGVDRLCIITPVDSRMVQFTDQLIVEAQRVGVRHIVKLSSVGASRNSLLTLAKLHGEAEEIVSNSGIPFAIVRPTMFMQNLVTMFGASIKNDNAIHAPAGEGKIPWIDARDVARILAEMIVKKHTDRIYTLTGSDAVSMNIVVSLLSKQLKREIEYVPISQEGARSGMEGAGMSKWHVDAMLELWSAVRAGNLSVVSRDYKTVMGVNSVSLVEFTRDHESYWK